MPTASPFLPHVLALLRNVTEEEIFAWIHFHVEGERMVTAVEDAAAEGES